MDDLKHALKQFTGSEQFYRHPLFRRFVYTEGVQFLAERAAAYWLLDNIFGHQTLKSLGPQPFQVWIIRVKDDKSAEITVEDGNDNQLHSFHLDFTTFPLKEFSLWLVEGTLLLPSEY